MAVEVSCDIDGISEFQDAMSKLDSSMQSQVHGFLQNWASSVRTAALRNVPARTGNLRNSIYAIVKEWVANIGAAATYAYFVEFGTRHMKAHPFLWPAIQECLPELESCILNAVQQARAEAGL
jgi:HK97 gp10 family phage protein